MNETIKAIMSRRSIRKFTGEKIESHLLETIASAGKAAPSGRNNQQRRFTVIQNKELIDGARRALGSRYMSFYGADTLILVSAAADNPYAEEDCSCAMENMMIAACSLGLGSVWINQFKGACGDEEIRKYLNLLKVPGDYNVLYVLALGVPFTAESGKVEKQNKIDYIL